LRVEVVALEVATVFIVEVVFWLVEEDLDEDLEDEGATFCATWTLPEAELAGRSLAPLTLLDLTTAPTVFFM
jgi:hypothetical protein